MNICMIGSGNVATHLALALQQAGHNLVQVYSKTEVNAKELADKLHTSYTTHLSQLADADVYLVSVKDDVIERLARHLHLKDKIVAHTSGTVSMNALEKSSEHTGIFYPLQTMKKDGTVDMKTVPFLLEGKTNKAVNTLHQLASDISLQVYFINEAERQWIHLSAVFANNFTNYLMTVSENLLEEKQLSFEIIRPLMLSFLKNLEHNKPSEIQTGPAARGDYQTMESHLNLLKEHLQYKAIYQMLSDGILHQRKTKS